MTDPVTPELAIPADWWTPASVARRVRCRLDLLAAKRAAGERPGPLPLVFARVAEVLCEAVEATDALGEPPQPCTVCSVPLDDHTTPQLAACWWTSLRSDR